MNELAHDSREDHEERSQGQNESERSRHRTTGPIPSTEELLANLATLSGLVAMRILSPAQANAIRANSQILLNHHAKAQGRGQTGNLADADVLALLRTNPAVLNALSPLLTDAQVDLIAERAHD